MLIGYIRPESRFPEGKQRELLLSVGVSPGKIWVEGARKRGDPFPARDAMLRAKRDGVRDTVVVSDMHRLATRADELKAVLRETAIRPANILEARTGRKVRPDVDLADMIFEATEFYAGRGLTHQEASRIGKMGAKASPVTKRKRGRMPKSEALTIWRDVSLTIPEALARINSDPRYDTEYKPGSVYRLLGKRFAAAGRRPKQ